MFIKEKYASLDDSLIKKVISTLMQLLVFTLPLHPKLVPILVLILFVLGLFDFFGSKNKFEPSKAQISMMLFYCFLIVGLLWTENLKSGFFDLEVKSSLVIFPILFSIIPISKRQFLKLIRALVYGVITFFLIAIFFAFRTYIERSDGFHYFLYARLSPVIHPSYMSLYITTAIAFLLHFLKSRIYIFFNKAVTMIVVVFLFIVNFMLLSKIGLFVSILIMLYYIVGWVRRERKFGAGIISLIAICLFFVVMYKNVEYVAQRVDEFGSIFNRQNNESDESSGIRLKIWSQAVDAIRNKTIIGYGTGDVKDVLIARYKSHGLLHAAEKKYNAHNQFLQILISSGIVGLVLFFLSGILGSQSNQLFIIFIIISYIYMSVESMLENQAGTIFFGLFYSMLSQVFLKRDELTNR